MMGATQALAAGVAWTGLVYGGLVPDERWLAGGAIAIGCSYVADIDHPSSTISYALGPFRDPQTAAWLTAAMIVGGILLAREMPNLTPWIVGVLSVQVVLVALLWLIRAGGHRQATHSLLAILIVTALAGVAGGALGELAPGLAGRWVALPAGVGYGAGVLCDLITKHGVALWWPISTERIEIPLISTGGLREALFALFVAGLGVGMVARMEL